MLLDTMLYTCPRCHRHRRRFHRKLVCSQICRKYPIKRCNDKWKLVTFLLSQVCSGAFVSRWQSSHVNGVSLAVGTQQNMRDTIFVVVKTYLAFIVSCYKTPLSNEMCDSGCVCVLVDFFQIFRICMLPASV